MIQDKYLISCPFCGSCAHIEHIRLTDEGKLRFLSTITGPIYIDLYYAKCNNIECQASQATYNTPQEVVINWNRRRN
jgi:hypothetical protein